VKIRKNQSHVVDLVVFETCEFFRGQPPLHARHATLPLRMKAGSLAPITRPQISQFLVVTLFFS
jgi:hypothetical protein